MPSSVQHTLVNGCQLIGNENGTITGTFLTPMLCDGSKSNHCTNCHKHDSALVKFAWVNLGLFASCSSDGVVKIWDSMFGTYKGTLASTVFPPTEESVDTLCGLRF